jgi:hypothetical protein
MYNLQKIIRRLDDWMNDDKVLYKFNIVDQKIQVYDTATNKILAYVDNILNYQMIKEYPANSMNDNEFILLQYTNSLLIRILSTC